MHRHFRQYLEDMEWLALALEDRFNGMLGEAALHVGGLTEQRPLAGAVSFVQVTYRAILCAFSWRACLCSLSRRA